MGCPFHKWLITQLEEGTYGWDVLFTKKEFLGKIANTYIFTNKESCGYKVTPMDGMSSL